MEDDRRAELGLVLQELALKRRATGASAIARYVTAKTGLKVSQASVSGYLNDKQKPRPTFIQAFVKAFQLTAEETKRLAHVYTYRKEPPDAPITEEEEKEHSALLSTLDEAFPSPEGAGQEQYDPEGQIYVIGGSGYYKIGRAKKVHDRVKHLATQLPWPVVVEHVIPAEDYAAAEKYLHKIFSSKRAHGEWFILEEDDLVFIKSIKRMYGSHLERQGQ